MSNEQLTWGLDVDGVITANPDFFKWWTHHLIKNEDRVCIITARNPRRVDETVSELAKWGVSYDSLSFMPTELPRDHKTQAEWKVEEVERQEIDIWLDNDFKIYEEVLLVDFSKCKARRLTI